MDNDELNRILTRNLEFTKQADTKTAFLSSAQLITTGFLINQATLVTDKRWSTVVYAGLFVAAGSVVYCLIQAVYPKLKLESDRGSHLYFGSIASMKLTAFTDELKKMKKEQLRDELVRQVYITSQVVHEKMHNVKRAFWFFMIFIALSATLTMLAKYR
jgi:hypothetical protein